MPGEVALRKIRRSQRVPGDHAFFQVGDAAAVADQLDRGVDKHLYLGRRLVVVRAAVSDVGARAGGDQNKQVFVPFGGRLGVGLGGFAHVNGVRRPVRRIEDRIEILLPFAGEDQLVVGQLGEVAAHAQHGHHHANTWLGVLPMALRVTA